MLITGLKNLNSGIKHYIDELTKYKTPAEIMDVLFNDYIENIVDKAYHRLLTSDNVSGECSGMFLENMTLYYPLLFCVQDCKF